MALQRGHYFISGRVQGVGFRYSTYFKAREIGVSGYVRNLDDGRVEVLAEGSGEQLRLFEAFLDQGPRFARVEYIEKKIEDCPGRSCGDFRIT